MTNQDIPLPAAVIGEAMAVVAATSPVRYTKVHADTIEEIAKDTWTRLEYMPTLVGFRPPSRLERYRMYLTKAKTYEQALAITWEMNFLGTPLDPAVLMPLVEAGQVKVWFSWAEQAATWPDDYEKQWADYVELSEAAANGEFD